MSIGSMFEVTTSTTILSQLVSASSKYYCWHSLQL